MKGTLPSFVATFLTTISLFTLAGFQVTSHEAATRLLGRQAAALIEIDRWLPAHREDLELLARDRPQSVVGLKDVPINVLLPSALVLNADEGALRTTIVRSMGETLYQDGTGAFRDNEGHPRRPGYDDPLRWSISLLDKSTHGFWKAALAISLLVTIVAVAGVLLRGNSPFTPIAVGAAFAAVLSLAVWLLAQALQGAASSPVDKEIALALKDGAWIGLRNGLALAVVMAGMRFVLASLLGREKSWQSAQWDLPEDEADAPTV